MLEKIKNYSPRYTRFAAQVHQFKDVRVLGLGMFVVIVLLVSWSGVKSIQSNYALQKQISRMQQQNDVSSLENANLQLKNEYYKTSQYRELSARRNFGLAAPGEIEIVVSKDAALAAYSTLQLPSTEKLHSAEKIPFYQKNLQAWADFLLHRPGAAGGS